MGEIANDMIEGLCCEECGIYFVKEHGHPVLCHDCFFDYPIEERDMFILATNKEL